MKKSLLIILVMIVVFLTGCSEDSNSNSSTDTEANEPANKQTDVEANGLSEKGVFPITEEVTTLQVLMRQSAQVLDYEDNEFTKFLEEKTNVKIEWSMIPEADWNTKLNLMLASGSDLPDVILGRVSNELLIKYGSQGIFQPLNDLIEKHAVEFKKVSEKVEGVINMISAPDGNIYSLPKISECYNCSMGDKMWINQVFLDNLGLEIPTTTDEFYDVLKAFKEDDPNQNGEADEIPLSAAINGWHAQIDSFLMSPFVLNDSGSRLILENGKLTAAYTKPEWKQGLAYMKKLTDEKLLDPISFSQDIQQLKQIVENSDDMMVGAVPAGSPVIFANVNAERKKNYVSIPPLEGPDGEKQIPWNPYTYNQSGHFVITSSCENECADIAMKWADQFFDHDVTVRSRYGVPDVDWIDSPDGKMGADGKPAKWEEVLLWGSDQKSHWNFWNPAYLTREWIEGGAAADDDPWYLPGVLLVSTERDYEPYKELVFPPIIMKEEETKELAQLKAVIDPFVDESIARFVLGHRDLEKEWEDYLKELENMGLERYLEITQQAYDRQWKK